MDRDSVSMLFALVAVVAAGVLWWVWRRRDRDHQELKRQLRERVPVDEGEVHKQLGMRLLQNGAMVEAIAEFKAALEMRPKDAQIQLSLGQAQSFLGNTNAAILHYDSAIELSPHFAEAWVGRGAALETMGEMEKAKESYERAIRVEPTLGTAHYNLARTFAIEGESEMAAAALRKAIDIDKSFLDEARTAADFEMLYGDSAFRSLVYRR